MLFILSRISSVPFKPDNPSVIDHALYITVIYIDVKPLVASLR
jgi:hypothetical protein